MFSRLVKIKLAEKGMTAKELAKAIGKTPQTLSDAMVRDDFKVSYMEKIADALDCELVLYLKDKNKEGDDVE